MSVSVLTVDTASLGDRSYLVHDGIVAFVVDPQRDIDRVLSLAEGAGVRITHVFETHIHNDYVTGGVALARATGAAYHVNADDPVQFDRVPVRDGDRIEVGSMTVQVLHTPGHTFTHLSYLLEGDPPMVFSGGSLLYGSTGRPDLLGMAHARTLASHQHRSVQLLSALPDRTQVLPTHGFGSFCSATATTEGATGSTIGRERAINPALTSTETEFVEQVLAGLDAHPAYYVHMAPRNLAGPQAPDLSVPAPADKVELRRRLAAGEWLVDLRTRTAFAAGHVPGTINLGLDGQFATYLGWLIPWGTPLTLLGATEDEVAQAQRELVRIGIDRPAAVATGEPSQWTDGPLGTLVRATFAELAQVRHHRPVVVLDVRRVSEWRAGHVQGAVNIPLHELWDRVGEVPPGEVWVHCAAGYRASAAASMLAARGRTVVHVDDTYDTAAPGSGLELVQT